MPKKTFTPEQIVGKLRQIEVLVGQGKMAPLACKEAGVADEKSGSRNFQNTRARSQDGAPSWAQSAVYLRNAV